MASKTTIRLLLTLVTHRGLKVRKNDVRREYLQTKDIPRTDYTKSPVEAGCPPNKGWFLLKMYSLHFDLIAVEEFKIGYATHRNDYLNVDKKQKVEDTCDKMVQKPQYGEI